jgi:hypothetical protein
MVGTAFPADRVLLVEQPGPWGRAGLPASRFPPELAAAVERRALSAGVRLQAVRRPGRTPASAARVWALACSRDGAEELRVGTWERPEELLEIPLDGRSGRPEDRPWFLVCAHGKHDPCCALRGRGVASALEQLRPGRVWETSHVGGDRFAANVLVLPSGLLYGRVPADGVGELADASDAGRVVQPLLRGRIGLAPAAQAAAAFAHVELALASVGAVHVVSSSRIVDGAATVRLATAVGEVTVTVRVERVAAERLTCASPGPGSYLRYRAIELIRASSSS